MTDIAAEADEVLSFWFEELDPAQWWRVDAALDEAVRRRFGALHARLAAGVGAAWTATPESALAAVIVLDQFSRNLYRGRPEAFTQDAAARAAADAAITAGFDRAFAPKRRAFFYMPFMHAESLGHQTRCISLFEAMGDENHLA
ncbi:MAG: DUF924 domain-containing protein, partial [Caulobacterales bacterium]|nr:DUF924 domain-containing protein [Caulobacterales bacterium]